MKKRTNGFTLIELLVTVALIGVAAAVALPFAQLVQTRAKEAELRVALRTIRQALDSYKAAADAGVIEKRTGASGYPPTLDVLVEGVPRSSALGSSTLPIVFLRRIPRDPFYPDREAPAAQTWDIRSYGTPPGEARSGADVFDVSSKSPAIALDGTRVRDW